MNIRKITSLTALATFLLVLLTSMILYIVPAGRVAYWSDWTLLGLSKAQWEDLHLNLGIAFLLACFLHLYYNWRRLTAYLQNRLGELRIITREGTVAILITLLFSLGTLLALPPFSTVVDLSDRIKDRAAQRYGEPPYGHAELSSLKEFAKRVMIDQDEGLAVLRAAGIQVANAEQTLLEISRANRLPPQEIYLIIQRALPPAAPMALPSEMPSGFGRKTLAAVCEDYGLNPKVVAEILTTRNLPAAGDMIIRDIAAAGGLSSSDIFELLRQAANTDGAT